MVAVYILLQNNYRCTLLNANYILTSSDISRTNAYQHKNNLPWLKELMAILSKDLSAYLIANMTCMRSHDAKLALFLDESLFP